MYFLENLERSDLIIIILIIVLLGLITYNYYCPIVQNFGNVYGFDQNADMDDHNALDRQYILNYDNSPQLLEQQAVQNQNIYQNQVVQYNRQPIQQADNQYARNLSQQAISLNHQQQMVQPLIAPHPEHTNVEMNKFILYYSPNCGHCVHFLPTWKKLHTVDSLNNVVALETVNCMENQGKCQDHGIQAFPTMLMKKPDGSVVEYEGPRTVDALVNFIQTMH